jgi:hypothetical protein
MGTEIMKPEGRGADGAATSPSGPPPAPTAHPAALLQGAAAGGTQPSQPMPAAERAPTTAATARAAAPPLAPAAVATPAPLPAAVERAARTKDAGSEASWWERLTEAATVPRVALAGLLLVAEWIVYRLWQQLGSGEAQVRPPYLLALLFLASLPVALAWLSAVRLSRFGKQAPFALDLCASAAPGARHPAWEAAIPAVCDTWQYERDRYEHSFDRVRLNAVFFGWTASMVLLGCAVLVTWHLWKIPGALGGRDAYALALSAAVATSAAFGLHLARCCVRIANSDFNARMFSWATRAIVLVVVADIGLFTALRAANTPEGLTSNGGAILLGLFVAVLGDRALNLLLEKAAAVLGVTAPARAEDSTLRALDGVTEEDIERFAEEGIHSAHDLAFVPTARVFFNTAHSLQRICDWQDQALLFAYVGEKRARTLFEKTAVRGAIDLRGLADLVLPEGLRAAIAGVEPAAAGTPRLPDADAKKIRDALALALSLDVGAIDAALATFFRDEVAMRLAVQWRSAVYVDADGAPAHAGAKPPLASVAQAA